MARQYGALSYHALILSLFVFVSVDSVSFRGKRNRAHSEDRWPPAGQIYSNPSSPPAWMRPSSVGPTLPLTAPPPVPASLPFPSAMSNLPLYYYSPVLPVDQSGKQPSVWPPSPPQGNPVFFPGNAPMRPLSLLDARGAEYMKGAKTAKK